jgi:polysaccharide biosynthesis transport protein
MDKTTTTGPFDSSQEAGNKSQVDFVRVINIVQKYFWIVILTSVIGIVLAYFITKKQTPYYKAHSSIVISSQLPSYMGSKLKTNINAIADDYWYESRYLSTQYGVIKSRLITNLVVRKLQSKYIFQLLAIKNATHREPTVQELTSASSIIRSLIMIIPIEDSRIVHITIVHHIPELTKILADKVAETYRDENLDRRLASTKNASIWLDKQRLILSKKLDNAEKNLYEFKIKYKIQDVSLENRIKNLSQLLVTRSNKVEELDNITRNSKAILIQFRKLKSKDPTRNASSEFLKNQLILSLRKSYYEEEKKLESLKIQFLERNPLVIQQNKILSVLKKQLKQELRIVELALVAVYRKNSEILQAAKDSLGEARKLTSVLAKLEKDNNKLKRERNETAKLYEQVLARNKETVLAGELKTNNIRILDNAVIPLKPFKPVLIFNLAMGLALGLFFGLSLLILLYYLDNTLKSQTEVEQYLKSTFLGFVPLLPAHELNTPEYDLFIYNHPQSPIAEAVRSIRTNILFMSPNDPVKTVVVTSSAPLEGKTTLSSYLAISMAMGGDKVLLVDADMRRPRIHKVFSLKPKTGLSSLIVKKATYKEAILKTKVENLYLLPCGPIPPNPAELQQSKQFDEVYEELLSRFDKIIFDTPPIGIVTDPAILAQKADGVIIVTRFGSTTRHMLQNTYNVLSKVQVNILGGIMNYVDMQRWGSRPYYYYRKGKKGRYGHYYSSYIKGVYGEQFEKEEDKGKKSVKNKNEIDKETIKSKSKSKTKKKSKK